MEGHNGAVQFVSGGERHLKFWLYSPKPQMNMPNVDPDGSKASASGLRSVRALYKVRWCEVWWCAVWMFGETNDRTLYNSH